MDPASKASVEGEAPPGFAGGGGDASPLDRQGRSIDIDDEKEIARLRAISYLEDDAYLNGYRLIAGIDEVGRGSLAGPVVAAAVLLPKDSLIFGVTDSKELGERKRESVFEEIKKRAVDIGIGIVDASLIDRINILQATILAMQKAVLGLKTSPDYLLIDAVKIPGLYIRQKSVIKGDSLSISIGAASIIAKVTRDKIMKDYHARFPLYNFISNKGYGTKDHFESLSRYGPCEIHRLSFRGVRS
ncbi:MAG: ribonuclease HII [Nitrospirota bacterium]